MTDLERKRGDTYADEFVVKSETTGLAIDITGFTFKLTVDPSQAPIDTANNIFSIVGVITNGVGGIVAFAPTTGNADNVGNYFYDAQYTDAGGKIRTFDKGKYDMIQDIAK